MHVEDAMTGPAVWLGPAHTLREAARKMTAAKAFSAVVTDNEMDQPGIITDTNIVAAVAANEDVDRARVQDHLDADFVVVAGPDWTLEQAAKVMRRTGVRRIVVCKGDAVSGILTVRDVVAHWTSADLANVL
jgi:signal-transduction protein with cAMP-binding, CBS, and nucleotidyltransferase domain